MIQAVGIGMVSGKSEVENRAVPLSGEQRMGLGTWVQRLKSMRKRLAQYWEAQSIRGAEIEANRRKEHERLLAKNPWYPIEYRLW